jgi:hypothetical protein
MVKRLSSKQEMQFDPDISLSPEAEKTEWNYTVFSLQDEVSVAEWRGNGLQNHGTLVQIQSGTH